MKADVQLDLQFDPRAPLVSFPDDREPILLGEDSFQQVLALEKKRTERSGTPILLMLINLKDVLRGPEREPLTTRIASALFAVTRETDVKGWYASNLILGVICTELGSAGLPEARDIIQHKVDERFRDILGTEQMRRVRLSFEAFCGKGQQELPAGSPSDIQLYQKETPKEATAKSRPAAAALLRHRGILLAADLVLIGLACFVSLWVRVGTPLNVFEEYTGACLATLLQYLAGLFIFDQYNPHRLCRWRDTFTRIGLAVCLGILVASAFFYIAPQWQFGRGVLAIQAGLVWLFLFLFRVGYARLFLAMEPRVPALVLGNGNLGNNVCKLLASPFSPFEVKGCLIDGGIGMVGGNGAPTVLGGLDRIGETATELGIKTIIIALPRQRSHRVIRKVLEARLNGIEVIDLPNLYERLTDRVPVQYIEDQWLLFADGFYLISKPYVQKLKRLIDLGFSSLMLVATFPLALTVALAIRLDSPGPVFYRQERTGKNNRVFTVWKFRSMCANAEAQGAKWAQKRDPRITRVGRWLRIFRIDELPQIWNVFKGEMSLVGPRPERPEFVRELNRQIPYYTVRHTVPPGITGWAQVQYPYGASLEDALRKLEYDLYYIKNMSILLDLKILLRTIGVVLLGEGAR